MFAWSVMDQWVTAKVLIGVCVLRSVSIFGALLGGR